MRFSIFVTEPLVDGKIIGNSHGVVKKTITILYGYVNVDAVATSGDCFADSLRWLNEEGVASWLRFFATMRVLKPVSCCPSLLTPGN
jgi:hypothetical protein